MGRVVYQSLQDNTHLTGAEKLEACSRIGHAIVQQEAQAAELNPATFLRTTTPGVKFINTAVQDMVWLHSGRDRPGPGSWQAACWGR